MVWEGEAVRLSPIPISPLDMSDQPQENKLEHPCFPQPGDSSIRVWRYLDLAKFIWLLDNEKLYLSRLDLLNDPHEGTTPKLLAALRDQQFRYLGAEQLVTQIPQINQQSRKSMYVNCWHLGNSESEAMWRLYCPGDNGVAIQTTYKNLVDSVDSDRFLYIGAVTYIDYESQGFPLNNAFYPVMHKRISFAHEQEVRLVKTLSEYWGLQAQGYKKQSLATPSFSNRITTSHPHISPATRLAPR